MKFTTIAKKSVFYMMACGFLSTNIHAQVVTPSLDPTVAVVLPAAAGWRATGGVGASYYEASGSRKKDTGLQLHKTDTTGMNVNAAFKVGNAFIDSYFGQETTDVQVDQYTGNINKGKDDFRINLALAGSDSVVVGLGGHNTSSYDSVDLTNDSVTTSVARIGGSVSVKMGSVFLGGGYQRVKQNSDYQVENTWDIATAGLAFMTGESGGTRFRVELSFALSPHASNEIAGDLEPSEHPATSTTRYGAELMIGGLLFTYQGFNTMEVNDKPKTVDLIDYYQIETSGSDAGVLWIPKDGLILGFHFSSDTKTFVDNDESSAFRVNIGYLF
ncbi:hypothetical protein KKA14_04080 [bacterium]|nr:hypothetical protein [bacterium]